MPERLAHDWFFEPLPANVFLGERNWLYSSFAFRHYRSRRQTGVRTGNDTGLYNGTFFDLGPDGQVTIGSYCTLVGAIICTNRHIVIRDHVLIAHDVVLADSFAGIPWEGEAPPSPEKEPETSILIDSNAWICTRAVLLGGASIGEGAVVGAGAVVDFEVLPYTVVAGNPARVVKRIAPQQ